MVLGNQKHELKLMVPHARTLRKAREQVKCMVIDGISSRRIRNYLHRWVIWWRATTSESWHYLEILKWFVETCWDKTAATYATVLAQSFFNKLCTETFSIFGADKLCMF